MPKTADQFNVQSDITLVFESNGKNYKMRLLISSGLIMLSEVGKEDERIIFINNNSHYTGEDTPTKSEDTPTKPKRKRRSKKKK